MSSVLTHTVRIPRLIGYIAVTIPTAGIILRYLLAHPDWKSIDRVSLGFLGAIWLAFIAAFALNPSFWSGIRTAVFIGFSFLVVCVLPTIIDQRSFEYVLSVISAVLCLVAIVIWATGTYFTIAGHHPGWYFPTPLPIIGKIDPIAGILDGSNLMGAVCVIGAFISIAHYFRTRNAWFSLITGLLVIGSILSASRTAILSLAAGLGILAAYYVGGRRLMTLCTLVGLACLATVLLSEFGFIPSVGPLGSIRFTGRIELWRSTWRAVSDSPFVGWGAVNTKELIQPYMTSSRTAGRGIHNSYLRMFAMTGFIGGVSYLGLTIVAGIRSWKAAVTPVQATYFALFIAIVVMQVFNAGTIFGYGLRSFLYAVVTGFALTAYRTESTRLASTSGSDYYSYAITVFRTVIRDNP
ncbi:O-antigen ligase [Haladaptatus sp. R4]|uniref:O-antigen ligase family protein n=1 Tax=Haladaptatus sp. R4 TaxID=1679489 RepID=UPI001680765B|nr:O-antigen ligase family protein [Haladaptatus sp. R4]